MASTDLRVQASSLQFSDTPKQQEHDIKALFELGKKCPVKSGTEAGRDNANYNLLKKYSEKYNHALHIVNSNWIAVDKTIIKPGTFRRDKVFVADTKDVFGPGHDSVMATVAFEHIKPGVGEINYGSVHYPTKGQTPSAPNWKWNALYAKRIEEWMRKVGKGNHLALIAGDFNMPDKTADWSFGRDFTSMADELKAWQNTGHGPIDGFASYNKDSRVKAKVFNVLDDSEMRMFTDHYVCRGIWTITHLTAKKATA